ncbi:MAG TPA: polysaccharide biosynthesis/export family protein [Verrucomicrobiae bacterium]|nr:polysaccharide biosynthesis/export family protein [Verrucomicrobiae bacterium]
MSNDSWSNCFARAQRLLLLSILLFAISGCKTDQFSNISPARNRELFKTETPPAQSPAESAKDQSPPPQIMVVREGDTLTVSVPGSPSLDTTQQVRTDGKIVLPLIGEIVASGKTPEQLQRELLKLYQPQVTAKQVIVTVQSPNIPVYVTGAVLRPGPITVNHPVSALDAIMEAGGFDYTKANLKAVVIVRQEKDRTVRYKLNLKKVLAGSVGAPFYLRPFDIVYVPERFTWY